MDSSESKPAASGGPDKSPLTACFVSWKKDRGTHPGPLRWPCSETRAALIHVLSTLTWTSTHTGNGCLQLCGDTAWEVEDRLDFGHSPPARPWPCKSHVENLRVIGSPTEQALPGLCRSHTVSLWAWRAGSLQRTQIVG